MSNLMETWLASTPIAHRGLHDNNRNIPENSMPAFQAAIEQGYPIELDIQLSADDVMVVFHDYNLKRMTGQNRLIKDVSSKELPSLMLAGTDYTIPTLDQILDFVSGQVPLLIEIKNEGRAGKLESKLCERLKRYQGEFAVQSFNPLSILAVKKNCPGFIIGQLSKNHKNRCILHNMILTSCLLNWITKPDFIAYKIADMPNKIVNRAKSKGLLTLGWTVKNDQDRKKAIKYCDNYVFETIRP